MSGINKVILVGHLGRDPELRQLGGGQKCGFTLATSRSWRNKQGEAQEKTEWHRVVCWGNLAGTVGQYAKKGRLVYVEGSLETREFEHNGEKQRTTEVNARTVEFLGPRDDRGAAPRGHGGGRQQQHEPLQGGWGAPQDSDPGDVPF